MTFFNCSPSTPTCSAVAVPTFRNTYRFLLARSIRQLTSGGAADSTSPPRSAAGAVLVSARSVNRLARSAASALRRADCAAVRSHVRDFHDRVADQIDTASATSATATAAHSASDHLIASAYETSAVTR